MNGIRTTLLTCKFFLRRYWPDLFTGASAIALYWLAYRLTTDARALLIWSIGITLGVTAAIIYFRLREKHFHFVRLGDRADAQDWVGLGTFEFDRVSSAYRITNSESGFIFSRGLTWGDYRFRFRFKIIHSCLGVIVRAVNLANFVMLQVGESGIRPHIRVNAGWNVTEAAEAGLVFASPLSMDRWYEADIACDKAAIRIRIRDRRAIVFDRQWNIPQGMLMFVLRQEADGEPRVTLQFAITTEYGTIGFRSWGPEEALVSEVLVEKLGG